jgi:hypothetical protein
LPRLSTDDSGPSGTAEGVFLEVNLGILRTCLDVAGSETGGEGGIRTRVRLLT